MNSVGALAAWAAEAQAVNGGWSDQSTLLLFLGGLLGGLMRHYAGQTARTGDGYFSAFMRMWRERWTLWHILSGGALAAIVPGIFKWYYQVALVGPPLFLLCGGLLIGGFGNFILVAILWRFGIFKEDPRAAGPGDGEENKP